MSDYDDERQYTVAELIEMLEDMPQDAIVAVKYRDDGGDYYGCDYDVRPHSLREDFSGVEAGTVIL